MYPFTVRCTLHNEVLRGEFNNFKYHSLAQLLVRRFSSTSAEVLTQQRDRIIMGEVEFIGATPLLSYGAQSFPFVQLL